MKKIKLLTSTLCLLLAALICASCTADADGEQTSAQESTGGEQTFAQESAGDEQTSVQDTADTEKNMVDDNAPDYELQCVGDKNYIVFDDISKYSSRVDHNSCVLFGSPDFANMKEFKNSVPNGMLTEDQKISISQFEKDENGKIKTVDFDNLYVPVLPQYCVIEGGVSWNGECYSFQIKDKLRRQTVSMIISTEDYYKKNYEGKCNALSNVNDIAITKTETFDDGKTAIYYTNGLNEYVRFKYVLTDGDKTCTVFKLYSIEPTTGSLDEEPLYFPHYADLYYTENDRYYIVCDVGALGEEVDDSYIMSFGATRYVDEPNTEVK